MPLRIQKYDDRLNPISGQAVLNPNWVTTEGGLPDEAVRFAEDFGKYLTDPFKKGNRTFPGRNALTTTQLRNFFSEIRRIQAKGYDDNTSDFYMLKPKLAYAKARVDSRNRIGDFVQALTELINQVIGSEKPKESFSNFVKFVEATVAYHKAYGGK